jgi:hypothetical protein
MNERVPYGHMRKLALLAREKIGQKRLLTETDQLLRNSRDLVSRSLSPHRTGYDSAFQRQRIQHK